MVRRQYSLDQNLYKRRENLEKIPNNLVLNEGSDIFCFQKWRLKAEEIIRRVGCYKKMQKIAYEINVFLPKSIFLH